MEKRGEWRFRKRHTAINFNDYVYMKIFLKLGGKRLKRKHCVQEKKE